MYSMPIIAVPGAPAIHGPGPVQCDDSSDDDEERGIYKVKLGADDTGNLGIKFREISIESVQPEGLGQYRAQRTLEPGFVLKAINGVPADRLAYNACVLARSIAWICLPSAVPMISIVSTSCLGPFSPFAAAVEYLSLLASMVVIYAG